MPVLPPFWWLPAATPPGAKTQKDYKTFCPHERSPASPCTDTFCRHPLPHAHSICPLGLRTCARLIVWPDGSYIASIPGNK